MIRLDKYLADMSLGTRSELKNAIRKGRVCVDGEVEKSSDRKIDSEQNQIMFDGREILYREKEYYMLNKPMGVVSASSDKKERTVLDCITQVSRRDLFPVGRLDKDTEGLLLLTNDGALSYQLLTPKKHVNKMYFAKVRGNISTQQIQQFHDGIQIYEDFCTLPATLELLASYTENLQLVSEVHVTIQEGKFHQIKKMFEAVGREVIYLKRLTMGTLQLDETLAPGEYRALTKEEVTLLKKLTH